MTKDRVLNAIWLLKHGLDLRTVVSMLRLSATEESILISLLNNRRA